MIDQDTDELRQRAEQILERPEFTDPGPSPLDRALNWIGDRIADVLEPIFSTLGLGGVGSGIGGLLGLILIAVLVVVLVRAVGKWRRTDSSETDDKISTNTTRRLSAREWADRATAHEQADRWDLALRCHYRATMAGLADDKIIREIPGSTSREWRDEAVGNDVAAEPMGELTDVFDAVWYGQHDAHRSEVEQAKRWSEAISSSGKRR
ncbi:MAG: DUF4129 domain-containing protein [Actinomycetia bacterium]|nr:DUF4129 domain-containing protein [Actinomycetes bacterium]MCP4959445.1 DUF4129 domain-containing protein [Actinomycetes bacterium]